MLKRSKYVTLTTQETRRFERWRLTMLNYAKMSYKAAMDIDRFNLKLQIEPSSPSDSQAKMNVEELGGLSRTNDLGLDTSSCSDISSDSFSATPAAKTKTVTDEEWLYHYMLAKCLEKSGPGCVRVMPPNSSPYLDRENPQSSWNSRPWETTASWLARTLSRYKKSLEALDLSGAKYPKKIILYSKTPYRAVEAVEVYYKTHALLMKVLLQSGPNSNLPFQQIQNFLLQMEKTAFVQSGLRSKTPGMTKKRSLQQLSSLGDLSETEKNFIFDDRVKKVRLDLEATAPASTPDSPSSALKTNPSSSVQSPDHKVPDKSPILEEPTWTWCLNKCKEAMMMVLQRLPLHYKAMYRLAHLYQHEYVSFRDLNTSLCILLGPQTNTHKKINYGGLFKDRRSANFFHGVWRIPTSDIDRSGNFAGHMCRSVFMTLNLLSRTGEWSKIVPLYQQLRKAPPDDK
ncbi:Calcineurin-binding protein cabin-1 [Cichlidogyrus casuarinus]|uniref:Calcineurin-binding protein cabin-1 n=1 Tax=Cichlidogyrus casuarinus TaxID=1844966 RepID=A0ABD2Q9D1_9PLAT